MLSLNWEQHDPAFNLALEEVLFDALSPALPGIFLLWRNRPSIIIGRHQNAFAEINAGWCRAHGIHIVRRSTGGGAVYHDLGNLNFSFLLWSGHSRILEPARFLTPVLDALRDVGVEAACSSRNDLSAGGRKIAGTALRRDGQRTLLHGCILVHTDTSALTQALAGDPEKFLSKGVSSHKARVANLCDLLPSANTCTGESLNDAAAEPAEVMRRLMDALTRHCAHGVFTLPDELRASASRLAKTKYRSHDWTWGRSPRFSQKFRRRFPWGRLECFWNVREGVIQECRLLGDFFALRDPAELEAHFLGLAPDAHALRAALEPLGVEAWFSGAEREPLLSFLCGEDSEAKP
ncbi:lipoate--protein ligase [uncultured Mailhella sp.]|uniref:lipoate--protein ligase n=1 Tax=uncultured Mailhella sp. TaxID=1981031 RepID=UPI00260D0A91|nr:lipoate--protein ligase [uncultured Mailhella sp.]